MEIREGTVIGPYVLTEKIGGGGFGEVWAGKHRDWEDRVDAFKFPAEERFLEQLRDEANLLRSLEHENVVRILDIDTHGTPPYIRMELVKGESLAGQLEREGKLPVGEALRVLRGVLAGLAYAHAKGIIHRDLKPGNILLGANGTVKLTDFGLAEVQSDISRKLSVSIEDLDGPRKPSVAGTLDYMAPELKKGAPPTQASDLYSLGVVLYRMLAGRLPAGLQPPSHFNPDVPLEIDRVTARMLDAHEERYASVEELRRDLDRHDGAPEADGSFYPARWADRWYPFGEILYLLSIIGLAGSLANLRAFTSVLVLTIASGFFFAVAFTSRLSRSPLLSGLFWGGLVFAFLGGRLHWTAFWGGLASMLGAAIVWVTLQFVRANSLEEEEE